MTLWPSQETKKETAGEPTFFLLFLTIKTAVLFCGFHCVSFKSWYLLLWGVEKRVSIVQKSIVVWPIVYWLQGFRRQHVMISFQTSVLFLWRHPYNPHYSHLSSTLEIPWWLKLKNMFLVLEDQNRKWSIWIEWLYALWKKTKLMMTDAKRKANIPA